MESASTGGRIEIGRVIDETFKLYSAHAAVLIGSAIVIFFVAGIIQGLFNSDGSIFLGALGSIVSLIAQALYTGFVIRLVADVRADGRRDMTFSELFSVGGDTVWRLIANAILRGIAVGIGLILLIVPGLFLLTIWSVTSPAIVAERRGIIDAFGRSAELVRGQGWQVFGVIVVMFLIVLVINAVLLAIGAAIGVVGLIILAIAAGAFSAPIVALVSSILFIDLGGDVSSFARGSTAPAPTV